MIRHAFLLAVLTASTVAHAQVNDSLVWIGGGSEISGIDYWDMASFDTNGTPGVAYNRHLFSGAPGNPVVTSVTLQADGTHLTTESGYWSSPPYRPYLPGETLHLSPSGEYDPHNFPPYEPDSVLVGTEPGLDGSWWVASEAGFIYRYNFNADENNVVFGQDVAVGFPTPVGSVLSDFEISDTHMYAFIEDAANNVTIYRQRTLSPEPMTTVASGKPYQALTLLDDGALILADVEYDTSLVRAGNLTRTSGSGPTWSVALDKPVIDMTYLGGFIWMLDAHGDVYKVDPADGSGAAMALFNTGLQTSLDFARGAHDATEDYVVPDDLCPTDPLKFLPGDCGCNFVEYDEYVYDSITGEEAFACVHRTADVDLNANIGARATIDAGAVVEAFASVGDDAFVGDRAVIQSQAQIAPGASIQPLVVIETSAVIYPGAVILREARVEECAGVFEDVVVGRKSVVGAGSMILANSTVGYDVSIPDDSELGVGSILGNLVTFTGIGPVYIGSNGSNPGGAVVGRGVSIGAGTRIYSGAVIGPDTTIGTNTVIEDNVRVRKNTTIGNGVYIEPIVKIGRDSTIGNDAGIAGPSRTATGATIAPGVCLPANSSVGRNQTASEPACSVPFNTTHTPNWTQFDFPYPSCGFGPPT